MKNVTISAIVAIIIGFLIYLMGAFFAADFNIANWPPELRGMIGFCGLCFSGIAFGMTMSNLDNK